MARANCRANWETRARLRNVIHICGARTLQASAARFVHAVSQREIVSEIAIEPEIRADLSE